MTRHFDHARVRTFLLVMLLAGASGCDSGVDDALPAIPTMKAPADGATDQANALELRWTASADAQTYSVEVSTNAQFSEVEAGKQGVTSPFLDVKGLHLGVLYHWRVRAHNEAGASDWSTPWTFTPTSEARLPTPPGLRAPTNNAKALPTSVMFEWTTGADARSYHLQISQEPNFLRKDVDLQGVFGTSTLIPSLVHGYTYFWRVRAYNPAGFSPWSDAWTFVVETN